MAACSAAQNNGGVMVASKGKIQRSGATVMAPGAISAVDDRWKLPGDGKEIHFEDTILGGAFINHQAMAQTLCNQSPEGVLLLERMGALFQREDDGLSYMLRIDGGHRFARCPFLEDRTGKEMLKAMASQLRRLRVPLHENVMVVKLLKDGGSISGALAIDGVTGEFVLFDCKAVILATGGAGTIYANSDNPIDLTGDGYGLALDAGATLKDMEFVQFYPVGFLFPPSMKGIFGGLLYYSRLYNAKGERFMEKYDPERLELSTRDRVSQAIMQEVREGRGGPLGGVFMDMTYHEPGFVAKMIPALYGTYMNMGKDPEKDRIEVAPTAHHFMGGMTVNELWESEVPGLFGAGETCGGMHGANRLSQNALAEILVSGMVSGRSAAKYALAKKAPPADVGAVKDEREKVETLLARQKGWKPWELKKELQEIMWKDVGIVRSEESLKRALEAIDELTGRPVVLPAKDLFCNRDLLEYYELTHMLVTARAVAKSARAREESRGAHFRSDFPEVDDRRFLKNFFIGAQGTTLELSKKDVDLTPMKPEGC